MNWNTLAAGLLAFLAVSPAGAATLTFTDRAYWTSQVNVLSNFDSGSQTVGTATPFNNATGLIITDLQIVGYNITSGTSYDLQRVNASAAQAYYQWNSGSILRSADKTATNSAFLRVSFLTPVNAFGLNLGAGGSSGAPASVSIIPQGLTAVPRTTIQQPTFAFFGVVSDTQNFSYVDIYINDTNRYLVIDDITTANYTPVAETAEPGTLVQLAAGTLLLLLGRRYTFNRSTAL